MLKDMKPHNLMYFCCCQRLSLSCLNSDLSAKLGLDKIVSIGNSCHWQLL